MPKVKHQDIRLRILDQCFRDRHRDYTIDALVEACNAAIGDYSGGGVSVRTIRDDIKFMRDRQGYAAPIETKEWDGKKCVYFYSDPKFSIFNTELEKEEVDKLKTALQMLGRFKGLPQFDWMAGFLAGLEDKFGIKGNDKCIIGLEQNIDYVAINYLSDFVDAIINKQVLQIQYRTFEGIEYDWTIHPYYIKQYNSRWFLFGRNNADTEKIYNIPLDRIISFKPQNIEYKENDLVDFDEYFDEIIGVTMPQDTDECKVVLKFDKKRLPYIISKPLHGSMRIKDRENCVVELNLKPNKELESLIFSFGNQVEVLEPQWLRKKIAIKLADSLKKYSDVKIDYTAP